MKSVRKSIMVMTCTLVVVSLVIMCVVSIYLNVQTANDALEKTMVKMVDSVSEQLYYHMRTYKTIVESAAADNRAHSPNATLEEKQGVLDDIVAKYSDFTRGNILDAEGTSIFTGDNFTDREYYQMAMQGKTWVSDPLVSKVTGAITIIIAAPIWENGQGGTKVVGVLYLVPKETFLNDSVADINVSEGAGTRILNKNGTIIAHKNMELVASEANVQEQMKQDASLTDLAALEREMMSGKSGFGTYTDGRELMLLAYAPISDSNGWSVAIDAPISDFMEQSNKSIVITIVLLVVSTIIALFFSGSLANGIGKPLNLLANIMSSIADTGRVDIGAESEQQIKAFCEKKNEIGTLARAASNLVDMLNDNVGDLMTIAGGDLTGEILRKSENDAIGNALTEMRDNLNRMFSEINDSAKQVTGCSRQISDVSHSFAQSSTEQAASVQQLSAAINEISNKTKSNAEIAGKAADLADTIKSNAEKGTRQMDEMMQAIKEINDASQSISKVIKVIDDIAFQTNILALNAAVEAARAGQQGKGFAVVAEEVRSLAAKSAEAAKDTGGLIANSIEKAEFGARIADETAASLGEIVNGINESTQLVGKIAVSSDEQSVGISEINKGIDQVAQAVQRNSATAQESAAASEQMNEQALLLDDLISRFKLKDEGSGRAALPRYSSSQSNQQSERY